MSEGEALKRARLSTSPAFHRAAAALLGSVAGQAHGRTRHRPAFDLRLDPAGAEGPRLCEARQEAHHAEDKGRVVVAFLENFFARYVEFDFTASLEEQLDRISNNEIAWQQVLKDFWNDFIGAVDDIKDLRVSEVLDALDEMLGPHIYAPREDGGDPRQCPTCGTGTLNLKAGKFGAFVGCSNYPECRYTRPLAAGSDAERRPTACSAKDPTGT
jgi:DNA topoisomerase-1